MKILLLALIYPDVREDASIYTDLAAALQRAGVDLRVVAPSTGHSTGLREEGGVPVLRVDGGQLLNVGLIRKGINNVLLPARFAAAIRTQSWDWVPDWIVTPTPPITLTPLVEHLRRKWRSKVYLILRDIFPQNAVDLGIMRKGPTHAAFRWLERRTYAISDLIGCMSPANAAYVLAHNRGVAPDDVVQFPNWIADDAAHHAQPVGTADRAAWGVTADDFLCVVGGNLGRPQRVDFVLDVASAMQDDPRTRFVIVGDGTEREKLEAILLQQQLTNVRIFRRLPRDEYQALVTAADVGLITLHEGFTIPNIPSRLLGYWAAGLPVVAATDAASDVGKAFIAAHDGGLSVRMGDVAAAVTALRTLRDQPDLARRMGTNGRNAVLHAYTATYAAERLLAQMRTREHA